jgi:hypothetical protein
MLVIRTNFALSFFVRIGICDGLCHICVSLAVVRLNMDVKVDGLWSDGQLELGVSFWED